MQTRLSNNLSNLTCPFYDAQMDIFKSHPIYPIKQSNFHFTWFLVIVYSTWIWLDVCATWILNYFDTLNWPQTIDYFGCAITIQLFYLIKLHHLPDLYSTWFIFYLIIFYLIILLDHSTWLYSTWSSYLTILHATYWSYHNFTILPDFVSIYLQFQPVRFT